MVVMHVIVRIDKARVNGSVCINNWNVSKINIGRNCIAPNRFYHSISNEDISFVDNIRFTVHSYNSALEDHRIDPSAIADSEAANHVLCGCEKFTLSKSWCWRTDFPNRTIFKRDVGISVPRIFSWVGEFIDESSACICERYGVSIEIVEFNSRGIDEDGDVSICRNYCISSYLTRGTTAIWLIIEHPV